MVKIRHIHDPYDPKGPALTIVSELKFAPEAKYPQAINFAVAVCNPKDNFSRKTGVAMAQQRLHDDQDCKYRRQVNLDMQRMPKADELENLIDSHVVLMDLPYWAGRLMKDYLNYIK